MRIGTPLSPSATRVMLLGSGELGKEVIIALQRLGVEVIAVDRYENAPGHQVAHRAHTINMADPQALRALVEQEKPHLIVPEIEAIATDELGRIEADGLAEVIPTARATQLTMNREGIRRLAAEELGLPTSRYHFASSLAEMQAAADDVGYPCFVKPVMSSSGKGQSMLKSAADVAPAWQYAIDAGRVNHGRVIVEECIHFDYEITLLTVRARGANGEIETHFCAPIGHRQVKGDDVWFSEVSPRPHDTGMVTMATQFQNEFELHARAILGLPVNTAMHSTGASAVIYGGMDACGIAFDGVAEALHVPDTDIRLFGKPEAFERRRMGVTLARATDTATARERAITAANLIKTIS